VGPRNGQPETMVAVQSGLVYSDLVAAFRSGDSGGGCCGPGGRSPAGRGCGDTGNSRLPAAMEKHKAPKEARREAHLCIGTGGMAMLPPPEFSPAPGREMAAPGGN
jgi:hypothetical protein